MKADHVIWNGRAELFWRANAQGYTRDITDAGLYTLEQAQRHCRAEEREAALPLELYRPQLEAMRARIETKLATLETRAT